MILNTLDNVGTDQFADHTGWHGQASEGGAC